MRIVEVTEKKHIKEFLTFPSRLYKGDKNYIRPLDKDIEAVFDKEKNKLLRRKGKAKRWLLENEKGETIGKVAAFINPGTVSKDNEQPTGGMGFFDCINDQAAANLLFDTCKEWLASEGMEAMDGPINFGDRDRWWGCLAEGFTEPNYCMPYNYPYYKDLFEGYGFQVYFNQHTYHRYLDGKLQEKVYDKAMRIMKQPEYSFGHMNIKEMDKYAEQFRTVYNKAWGKHGGVALMSELQAKNVFQQMKPVVDPSIVWFAYYNGEPIAFFIMLPELNQIFKHLHGKFDLWAKLKFLWYQKTGACKKIFGVVFGVIPEFQGKGVEAAIVVAFTKVCFEEGYRYNEIEFNWIGDFNPKMMRVAEDVGGSVSKTHITFRKLFDESREFKRMKIIG